MSYKLFYYNQWIFCCYLFMRIATKKSLEFIIIITTDGYTFIIQYLTNNQLFPNIRPKYDISTMRKIYISSSLCNMQTNAITRHQSILLTRYQLEPSQNNSALVHLFQQKHIEQRQCYRVGLPEAPDRPNLKLRMKDSRDQDVGKIYKTGGLQNLCWTCRFSPDFYPLWRKLHICQDLSIYLN